MTTDSDLDDVIPPPTTAQVWRRVGVETGRALSALALVVATLAAMGVSVLVAAVFGMRMGSVGPHCTLADTSHTRVNPCSGPGHVLQFVVVFFPLLWVPVTGLLIGLKRLSLARQWLYLAGGVASGLVLPVALVTVLRW